MKEILRICVMMFFCLFALFSLSACRGNSGSTGKPIIIRTTIGAEILVKEALVDGEKIKYTTIDGEKGAIEKNFVSNMSEVVNLAEHNINFGKDGGGSSISQEQIKPTWRTSEHKDKMTGKLSEYAYSPTIMPLSKMGFPYGSIESNILVGCQSGYYFVFIEFNIAPNLLGTETKNGYNAIRTRIKWGTDAAEYVSLGQDWGSKNIYFSDRNSAISKIRSEGTLLLELNWYDEGTTYFEYQLDGAKEAIDKINGGCPSMMIEGKAGLDRNYNL
jgi:hypothetical protein